VLNSTVARQERLVGAKARESQDAVERNVAAPFHRFVRNVGTDAPVWGAAGRRSRTWAL
jgi:hypothetical protein